MRRGSKQTNKQTKQPNLQQHSTENKTNGKCESAASKPTKTKGCAPTLHLQKGYAPGKRKEKNNQKRKKNKASPPSARNQNKPMK